MEEIHLTTELMRNFKKFRGSFPAHEALLYLNKKDGYLYKVYFEELIPRVQKNIIGLSVFHPINHVLQARALLYRDGSPVGIKMENLISHEICSSYIRKLNISFEEKISSCQTFIQGVKSLHSHNYIVGDINLHNVMIENGIATLIDIYDGSFDDNSEDSLDYSFSQDIVLINLVVLSILYGIDFEDMICKKGSDAFKSIIESSPLLSIPLKQYILSSMQTVKISKLSFIILLLYMNLHNINIDVSKKEYIDSYLNQDHIDIKNLTKK